MPKLHLEKLSKRAYIGLAAAVCAVLAAVVVLFGFAKGAAGDSGLKTKSASSQETAASQSVGETSVENTKSTTSSEISRDTERHETDQTSGSAAVSSSSLSEKSVTSWSVKQTTVTKKAPGNSVKDFNEIDNFERHMLNNITSDQKIVFEQIMVGIKNFETVISIKDGVFKSSNISDLESLFVLVKIACIENSSVSSKYQYAGKDYVTAVKLTYTKTKEEAKAEEISLNEKTNRILSGITDDMSEFERLKYIHDAIIKGCEYGESETGNGDSAYGCLVEGKAVCEGYAKAMLLLCSKAGIDCVIVTGSAVGDDGEYYSHMWNMVKFGGNWYHIDPTWDDPSIEPADSQYVRYDFFNLTEKEISKTHKLEPNAFYKYPSATALSGNYFVYTGYLASDYKSGCKALKKAMINAVLNNEKYVSIQMEDRHSYELMKSGLFDKSSGKKPIYKILKEVKKATGGKISTKSVKKIYSDQTRVLTFIIKYT